MANRRNEKKAPKQAKRIAFVVKDENAKKVVLTGDFTGWKPEGIPLEKTPHGEWHTVLELEPGEYQYRLIVDGQWRDHADAHQRVPNPHGGENCVLRVEA